MDYYADVCQRHTWKQSRDILSCDRSSHVRDFDDALLRPSLNQTAPNL